MSMVSELQTFAFWVHVFFCALGASILYNQWGRAELRVYTLSSYLDTLKFSNEKDRERLEMLIFILVGTAIAMGVGHPKNIPQSFAAGAGFTGLSTQPNSASRAGRRPSNRKQEGTLQS